MKTVKMNAKKWSALFLMMILTVALASTAFAGHMTSVSYGPGWVIPGQSYDIVFRVKDQETMKALDMDVELKVTGTYARYVDHIDYNRDRIEDGFTTVSITLKADAPYSVGTLEVSAYSNGNLLCKAFEIPVANVAHDPIPYLRAER